MYRKKVALLCLSLVVYVVGKAQDDKKIEISIVPTLGFNVSFPQFTDRGMKKQLSYTTGTASTKDGYAGIGLQVQFWDEWQATIKIANTAYGNSWRYRFSIPSSNYSEVGKPNYASDINLLDFTTEKKLYSTGNMNVLKQQLKVRFQALVGIRYNWVPKRDRSDSVIAINSSSRDSMRILRNASGGLSVGANAQLYFNGHRSLKIGAMYTYAPNPVFEFRTEVNYFGAQTDKFKTFGGRHQLLFYVEYPICFLKRKV